jgi:hypothetical protein
MRKLVSIAVALVVISTCASAANFNDINGHWAETTINKLADKGIVTGFGDNSFKPNGTVTRAQYLKMIMNAVGIEEVECSDKMILDANKTDWYSGYLNSALKKGLIPKDMISGYKAEIITDTAEDGSITSSYVVYSGAFNGNDSITREEMAFLTMSIYQYVLNAKTMQDLADKKDMQFLDVSDISDWALTGVQLSAANGLIEGMDDGKFYPKETTTRAQAATVIDRVLEKIS